MDEQTPIALGVARPYVRGAVLLLWWAQDSISHMKSDSWIDGCNHISCPSYSFTTQSLNLISGCTPSGICFRRDPIHHSQFRRVG